MHEQRIASARANRWIITPTFAVLILGAILSRVMEPGVGVAKVTLAGDTPALKFIPTAAGPHPVALLAHGYASSKGNGKGEVTAVIVRFPGIPIREGKKLKTK